MRGLEQWSKFTYILETDEGDGMDQMRDLKQIGQVPYNLDMDKGDGMG